MKIFELKNEFERYISRFVSEINISQDLEELNSEFDKIELAEKDEVTKKEIFENLVETFVDTYLHRLNTEKRKTA